MRGDQAKLLRTETTSESGARLQRNRRTTAAESNAPTVKQLRLPASAEIEDASALGEERTLLRKEQ